MMVISVSDVGSNGGWWLVMVVKASSDAAVPKMLHKVWSSILLVYFGCVLHYLCNSPYNLVSFSSSKQYFSHTFFFSLLPKARLKKE